MIVRDWFGMYIQLLESKFQIVQADTKEEKRMKLVGKKHSLGDVLIIFKWERDSSHTTGHAGIYLGNDTYVHSPRPGKTVTTANGARKQFTHVFRFN